MLLKSHVAGTDFRDLLREYRSSPIKGLNVSPAQMLFSRQLRGKLPVTIETLRPKVPEGIYEALCDRQEKMKNHYDRTARRQVKGYCKGD
jgi:hypothetical protein